VGRGDLSRGVSASPGIVFCAAVAGGGRTPDLDAFESQPRGVPREARIWIGAESPRSARWAAILQGRRHGEAGSSGGGARSLGLVRIARLWFRGVPFGEEEGRGERARTGAGCVRERLSLGLDFRTERTMTG